MTPRKQSRRRSGAGGCITSASRRAEKSLSSTHNNKSVRFQTTQKDLLLRVCTKHAKFARFSSKCREKSPVPPPPPTVVVVRDDDDDDSVVVSSRGKVQQKRAFLTKRVLKSKVPLCFFEVFLLFPPMFFPPFFSKTKKKKEKKKEACNLGYQMNTLKKGLSL